MSGRIFFTGHPVYTILIIHADRRINETARDEGTDRNIIIIII